MLSRRVISLGACLALLAMGPAPISACLMPSEMPMDCAPPPVQKMNCESLGHGAPSAMFTSAAPACCHLSAPIPEAVAVAKQSAKSELPETSGSEEPAIAGMTRADISPSPFPESPGALERQARLCVFLI